MLDLDRLARIRLSRHPTGQYVTAYAYLMPNFRWFPGVDIQMEGLERVPEHAVIFAMNHTDRFNYWPFQYELWRRTTRFTATWVKGKYYENNIVGALLQWTNNIPAASRGYVISHDFLSVVGRKPTDAEYEALRRWVDDVAQSQVAPEATVRVPAPGVLPAKLLETAHDMLGRFYDPAKENYAHAVDELFREMTRRFVAINRDGMEKQVDLLVFPQGTRSVRLSRGHIGLAQVALHLRATIVPVGSSGSDHLYPGSSPWAKRGKVTYRIGDPIPYEEMSQFHIGEDYEPFTPEAEFKHRAKFQGLTDMVMDRINPLLDPPYQFGTGQESDGVQGSNRFV